VKALSIKQPWAWLIVNGFKDIENRNWSTMFRGRIYVHAGLSHDELVKEVILFALNRLPNSQASEFAFAITLKRMVFGAIIGEVDIIDCVTSSQSPWFTGPYGFVLSNPVLYPEPIPCKGRLGFFDPELQTNV